jgi:hypothetical protein
VIVRVRAGLSILLIAVTTGCFGKIEATQPNPNADTTLTGLNFEAKIDGAAFVGQSATTLRIATSLSMQAIGDLTATPRSISITILNPAVGTFQLKANSGASTYASVRLGFTADNTWNTQATSGGTVTITTLNETYVEGTFAFDADASTAATALKLTRVTEGKFKLRICPIGTPC